MNEQLEIALPEEYEIELPDPCTLAYYKNKEYRVIIIDYEIDDSIMREIGGAILEYNRDDKNISVEDRKKIVFLINSPGGCLESTYALIALMHLSKTPIITVNMNRAYSAAGLILLAGHKRYCLPRSQMLIHSGSASGIGGNYEDIQEGTKSYKKMVEEMREFIMSSTKIDKTTMNKNKSKDWYLDVENQVKFGCVDEVLTDIDEIL